MEGKIIIRSKLDILKYYYDSAVPRKDLLIGIEVERSGVFEENLQPVQYNGAKGYLSILKKLIREVGWKTIDEDSNGNIFALRRGKSYLHTEMDGRFELASKPRKHLANLNREFTMYEKEINEISKSSGIRWVSTGYQPFSDNSEILWSPKKRGYFLRKLLFPNKKGRSESWLKKTNSVHVNFGYTSEEDAITKFQTTYLVAPILGAMYACSPLSCNRFSGYMGNRLRICQEFSPERNAVRKEFFADNFSFEKWIDYTLNLPVLYITRNKKDIPIVNTTFLEFITNGYIHNGRKIRPQIKDYLLHLKSIWTEVRMKGYLELRTIDCVPPSLLLTIPTLIRGITLNKESMKAVSSLTKNWSFEQYCQVRDDVNKYALQAEIPGGKKILTLAKELLEITSESIKMHQKEHRSKTDASRFLWPIKEYIFVKEQSPAEHIMEMWNGEWHKDPRKLIEWSEQ